MRDANSRSSWTRRPPAWMNRRSAGRLMIGIAALGFVTAVVGTIVAWQLIGQLGTDVDRSLRIGEQTLVTLDDTIDVADEVVTSVQSGLTTIEATLGTVNEAVGDTTELASTTSELASALPTSLTRIEEALATLEQLGGTIDDLLSGLSSIPFAPDYDPAVPLATRSRVCARASNRSPMTCEASLRSSTRWRAARVISGVNSTS